LKDILKTKAQKYKKDELIKKLSSEFNKFKNFGVDLNEANKTANKAKLTTIKTDIIVKKCDQDIYDLNKEESDKQRNKAKDELFFLAGEYGYAGEIKKLSIYATTQSPATVTSSSFYGLGINPTTNEIYAGRGNFSGRAYVLRFNSDGTLIDSVLAGIAPNGFAFN
jgi:hypothetical protein